MPCTEPNDLTSMHGLLAGTEIFLIFLFLFSCGSNLSGICLVLHPSLEMLST